MQRKMSETQSNKSLLLNRGAEAPGLPAAK